MTQYKNSFEGGTNGTTVTTANSGGASGDAWDSVATQAPTYDNTQVAHGTLAGKFTSATGPSWVEKNFVAATGTFAFRAYIYAATAANLASVQIGTGTSAVFVTFDSTGHPLVQNGATTTLATFTNAAPVGAWFRIEGQFTLSTTGTGSYSVSLYTTMDSSTATETKSASSQTFASATITLLDYRVKGGTHTAWFDDIAENDTGTAIGPTSITNNVSVSATCSLSTSVLRGISKAIPVTATTTPTVSRGIRKSLAASVTSAATVSALKVKVIVVAATVATAATIRRSVGRIVSASATTSATVRRAISKGVALTATTAATVKRSITKACSAAVATTTTVLRSRAVSLSAGASTAASVARTVQLKVGATAASAVSLIVLAPYKFVAGLTQMVATVKGLFLKASTTDNGDGMTSSTTRDYSMGATTEQKTNMQGSDS